MDYSLLDLRKPVDDENDGNKTQRIVVQGHDLLNDIPMQARERGPGVRLTTENGDLVLTDDDLSTGTLILGATGCGKTTLFFKVLDEKIRTLTKDDVMIIFDSKGDYKERYYQRENPNHIIVSISDEDEDESPCWNIFGELLNSRGVMGKETELIAGEISRALFKGLKSETQPFFNMAAEDLFAKILTTFVKDAARGDKKYELNNEELYRFVSGKDSQALLSETDKYTEYKYLRNYVGDGTSNQALGVKAYLSSMVSQTFVSSFRYQKPAGSFSMRKLVRDRGGKIIFLEYDIGYSETLSAIYSLFYDLAIKEALSKGKKDGSTYFICDEMNLIPYVSKFEELLNFGRSKGCKTLIGLQSVAQLKKNYDEEEAESILAGFLTAFCFYNIDIATRKYVKERFGETFEIYNYGGNNISRNGYTLSDVDIMRLRVGEAVIDMKGVPPFKSRFLDDVNRDRRKNE